ncbi:hypothetical protein BKM30_12025 [Pseudomonas syringae pv. syringae]|nr:hypothetical protein BKM27_12640 [Pseudomonas syringae pv. syringae]POR78794.1 hypothetical protein BKM30_12025 [Pseudomonas syringae pv. syringae]
MLQKNTDVINGLTTFAKAKTESSLLHGTQNMDIISYKNSTLKGRLITLDTWQLLMTSEL